MRELSAFREFLNESDELGFDTNIKTMSNKPGVLLHQLVSIDAFDLDHLDMKGIELKPYHLIFGDSSLAIFDAFGQDQIAGLTRQGAAEHIAKLEAEGKTEERDAYIAGLTNFVGDQIFLFINVPRVSKRTGIVAHESLHLTRYLITLAGNEWMRNNLKTDKWWEDEKAVMTDLKNENEEYFAEVLERVTSIAYDGWFKVKGKV